MQHIDLVHDFALSVERVYGYLSEHENLGRIFGARVERLRDGHSTRNGEGSVRTMRVLPFPSFEETVTAAVPNELLEYRITRGGFPVKDHSARMTFTAQGIGTRLRYQIALGSQVPGMAPVVAAALRRNLRRGLAAVDVRA